MRLRPATDDDSYFFLHLRNDRATVLNSHRPAVSLKEHAEWWATTDDIRLVAWVEDQRVGTLRISCDDEVSIVVAPEHRGKGYATEILKRIGEVAGRPRLIAEVLPSNRASQRAFLSAGWTPILFQWTPQP